MIPNPVELTVKNNHGGLPKQTIYWIINQASKHFQFPALKSLISKLN